MYSPIPQNRVATPNRVPESLPESRSLILEMHASRSRTNETEGRLNVFQAPRSRKTKWEAMGTELTEERENLIPILFALALFRA